MESNNTKQISINIPNYSGPLEVLLDLAKTQKVDLAEISISQLADQFLEFIKKSKSLNLETASEFLLMATWLAYLKSKLLLPEDEEDDFKALEVAEKLKLQLKKLELIRILSDQMLQKKRLGVDIFTRGIKGGIRSINTPVYNVSLYELLKTYSSIQMQKTFNNINIPKLPVFTAEEGIKHIKNNLEKIIKIVHTEIRKKMNVFLKKHKNKKFVILDIPLLLENKINKKKDILVFLQSNQSDILKRLKKRKNFNQKILQKFKTIQYPISYKKKKSDFIIKNNFKKNSVINGIKNIQNEIT